MKQGHRLPKYIRPVADGQPFPCRCCSQVRPLSMIFISDHPKAAPAAGPWCADCVDDYQPTTLGATSDPPFRYPSVRETLRMPVTERLDRLRKTRG